MELPIQKRRPESKHQDDITKAENDTQLKMEEALWRTTSSSEAAYFTASCVLSLPFSTLMTHGPKK